MAQRHAEIQAQIRNVHQLETVVNALRGIAAARAQHSRALLPGVDAYCEVISAAIGQALALLPPDGTPPSVKGARRGLIAFTAELGFAGTYAERLLDAISADWTDSIVFLIGSRGLSLARERNREPMWSAAMPNHIDAIPSLANRLAEALYSRIASGEIAAVDMVYARPETGGDLVIERHSLLPLDFDLFIRAARSFPPVTTLAPQTLLERLSEEYVFAQLHMAALNAYEAENQARMRAMAEAKANIETKLAGLQQQERQVRQEEITDEIIELTVGSEATRR